MSEISLLAQVANGLTQNVNTSTSDLDVLSLWVGGTSGGGATQLTKTILNSLISSAASAMTSVTGDVTGTGPGATAVTVNSVGGSSASNIHSAELAANAATNLNTASTIVKRDVSGNFVAGIITALEIITNNFLNHGSDLSISTSVAGILNSNNIAINTGSVTSANSGNFVVSTGISSTGNTGNLQLFTGASSSGGDTGGISLTTGSTSGSRGKIQLVDGSEGTAGYVWTSTDTLGNGHWAAPSSGSVSSVALSDGSTIPIYSISGSPVTSSGTLTFSLISQGANKVLASPDGSSGQPTIRSLVSGDIPDLSATYVTQSEVGANNGVASLDAGGKVPAAQLPSTIMNYQGAWDASTNTPTLADGTGTNGDVWRASVAGTQNLGSGPLTFAIGDFAIYNGSIWQHSPAADGVSSVNGMTGAVTVNAINQLTGDITAGPASGSASAAASLVATSNSTLVTLSALSLPGSQVIGSIAGNSGGTQFTATTNNALSADTSYIVRMSLNGESSGNVALADSANASVDLKFWGIGMVSGGAGLSAGDPIQVVTSGIFNLGASDTPFGSPDLGLAVWLTSSGAFSTTSPSSPGDASYKIGTVASTTSILINGIQLTGIN